MAMHNAESTRSWLQLGVGLLVQTAAVVAFLWQMHVDLQWVKEALNESKVDRRALHEAISQWPELKYRLESCEKILNQHVQDTKRP